jgi:hypothetical protein
MSIFITATDFSAAIQRALRVSREDLSRTPTCRRAMRKRCLTTASGGTRPTAPRPSSGSEMA